MFTDSPPSTLAYEASHRGHAFVDQVIADLHADPPAHQPSGMSAANAAWPVCAAGAFDLNRATGMIASNRHGPPRPAPGSSRSRLASPTTPGNGT